MAITFEEYVCPAAPPEPFVIEADEHGPVVAPEVAEEAFNTTRVRVVPRYFLAHGNTGGCPGCIQLQRGVGVSRNHSEACRSRMEGILEDSVEGKMRKDRAAARREEQLTWELERQDKIITNAKPEGSILIDEMQDDNGDKKGYEVGRSDAEDLQDGPMVDNGSRVIVADDDMVAHEK